MSTKTKIINDIPMCVQRQYRTCNKPNCYPCRTGKRHGPYFYGYYRKDKKLHSYYIGKALPEQEAK